MARFFFLFSFFFAGMFAFPHTGYSHPVNTNAAAIHTADGHSGNEIPDALPESPEKKGAARTAVPDHHAKPQVPKWDELAHIHHFHKHRMKKLKKHYKKCLFGSKVLLLLCHAAVLLVSFLHVVSH